MRVFRRQPGRSAAQPAGGASRRMGGMDSGFLALELPEQPMTNLYLVGLAPPDRPGGRRVTIDDLRRRVEERLDYLPAFRWRVVPVPHGLHHPIWADDPSFDLGDHLSEVVLDPPGGRDELLRLCGRMVAGELDRHRPLWDLTLVEGLAGGRQALVLRAHHCMLDGAASLATLRRLFADDGELEGSARQVFAPLPLPDRRRLARSALRDQARNVRGLPSLVARTARAVKAKEDCERAAPVKPPRSPEDVPSCRINEAFGAGRRFTTAALEVADVKFVREVAGVSFTDVVLAVVGGALRAFLVPTGELPAEPLVAGCPVTTSGGEGAERAWGNRFSSIVTSLATDVADPWERLARVAAVTAVARRVNEPFGDDLWAAWLTTLPPALTERVVRRHHRNRRRRRHVANASITISNVPGPARPWHFGEQQVDEVFMSGPPNNGVGAVVALFTYAGKVCISVNSIEDSVGDGSQVAAGFTAAMDELVAEASRRAPAGTTRALAR